ncbi:Reverse transcriptase (RNA-dependent DNA polymerase) [Nesidiocoris tenuis]|uniref:Reverse transcriptase (RNA-dependent DNA polymerase) n=1 Tax=Nesidiocoris tenuis TaxID=355587 RepID=A0ABN7B2T9_9HEMI|nr:Reverse transcriptase (RNA-dependent DNA polymerase) [Nesidiocoris tenuis]
MELDSFSDHLPCLLSSSQLSPNSSCCIPCCMGVKSLFMEGKLKWDAGKVRSFQACLSSSLKSLAAETFSAGAMYQFLKNAISEACKVCEMWRPPTTRHIDNYRNCPWFDSDCKRLKYESRNRYRKFKRSRYNVDHLNAYLAKKNDYKACLRLKKRTYYERLREDLARCNDSKGFWSAVNKLRSNGRPACKITVEAVENFFSDIYPCAAGEAAVHQGCGTSAEHPFDPLLDSPITKAELETALKACKNGKSAGEDGIGYEFYRNMPPEGVTFILSLFNKILEAGCVPAEWGSIKTFLLFKKGDPSNVANYRGISLLNCLAKIFTRILYERLVVFVESKSLIPETQNGFRKGRGCADNVFVLSSLVNINTRLKRRKVFCAFVDFFRAFDAVSHPVLWGKLEWLGVSPRFISVIRALYECASFSVRVGAASTRPFRLSQGILQGDILSPLLFALLLADFDEFVAARGIRGLSIDGRTEVTSLFYADDCCLLADSGPGLQRLLNVLQEYCEVNRLKVNSAKSKVVIFQRRGRQPRARFSCGGEAVEVVKSFVYLGVTFSRSGVFTIQTNASVKKGTVAYNSVWPVVYKSQSNSPRCWKSLYTSIIRSTTLYLAELWGFPNCDLLERVQVRAFKALLHLPSYTPDYAVRYELGLPHSRLHVVKGMLRWWCKLLAMGEDRLPRRCFNRLLGLAADPGQDMRYNWALQLQSVLDGLGSGELLRSDLSPADLRTRLAGLIEREADASLGADRRALANSSFMKFPGAVLESTDYLSFDVPLYIKRLVCQVRLSGDERARIFFPRVVSRFAKSGNCTLCSDGALDTVEHLMATCTAFRAERVRYLGSGTLSEDRLGAALQASDAISVKKVFLYLQSTLRMRNFILSEGQDF